MGWRTGELWRDVSGELMTIISAIAQARAGGVGGLKDTYLLKLHPFQGRDMWPQSAVMNVIHPRSAVDCLVNQQLRASEHRIRVQIPCFLPQATGQEWRTGSDEEEEDKCLNFDRVAQWRAYGHISSRVTWPVENVPTLPKSIEESPKSASKIATES